MLRWLVLRLYEAVFTVLWHFDGYIVMFSVVLVPGCCTLLIAVVCAVFEGLRACGALDFVRVRHAEFSARFLAFYD